MKIIELKDLTFDSTNIPDDTTPEWSATAGYSSGTKRQLNNKLYELNASINPLALVYYDNSDPLNPDIAYSIETEATLDASALVLSTGDVVYIKDNGSTGTPITNAYYVFDTTAGAIDLGGGLWQVDLASQSASPTNFSSTTGYRNAVLNPETDGYAITWTDLGYTNKYKMIDNALNSQTVFNGDMEMSFLVSKIDSIFLFRLFGNQVDITVTTTNTSTVIFDESIDLRSKNSGHTWKGYFFNDFTNLTKIKVNPQLGFNVRVDIKIWGIDGVSKCGLVGMGRSELIGGTLYGSSVGMQDFSKRQTNPNTGEDFIEEGNYKPTNNLMIDVPNNQVDSVIERLQELRAKPVIYEASIYTSTIIFAKYDNWDSVFSNASISRLSLNLVSLI